MKRWRMYHCTQIVALLLILSLIPLVDTPHAYAQNDRCFSETGFCISGRVREYWEQNGGLPVFGYPIGPQHDEDVEGQTFQTQWFERTRFELHPENQPPYDVLLGRIGADALQQRGGMAGVGGDHDSGPHAGCLWFEQTQRNVCDQAPGIGFKSYWQSHGLQFDGRAGISYDESLALFGLPISATVNEPDIASGSYILTQWFERARFEWHPDKPNEYKVLLGLLGRETVGGQVATSISDLTDVNGTLFFVGGDGRHGLELWKSDGTAGGTVMVKDINPGVGDAFDLRTPHWFTSSGGLLFFTAQDGSHGYELWRSDGTADGTTMVADIKPGAEDGYPSYTVSVKGELFFSASSPKLTNALWKSDGTAGGTALLRDSNGAPVQWAMNITSVNGQVLFGAYDEAHGFELWKSDGTPEGTTLVKDIAAGAESAFPELFTNVNGTLFFRARSVETGTELWKSDGTPDGTVLVKDIQPGTTASNPERLVAIGDTLFFDAVGPDVDLEVWKSDGTADGTVPVRDINPGVGRAGPEWLTRVQSELFFVADDGQHGRELWSSDGSTGGTVLVKDIQPGPSGGAPDNLAAVAGTLFFFADDGQSGRELWKSDGTAGGTVLVKDLTPGAAETSHSELRGVGGVLYFVVGSDETGRQLWRSDGTAGGTWQVKNMAS